MRAPSDVSEDASVSTRRHGMRACGAPLQCRRADLAAAAAAAVEMFTVVM